MRQCSGGQACLRQPGRFKEQRCAEQRQRKVQGVLQPARGFARSLHPSRHGALLNREGLPSTLTREAAKAVAQVPTSTGRYLHSGSAMAACLKRTCCVSNGFITGLGAHVWSSKRSAHQHQQVTDGGRSAAAVSTLQPGAVQLV